MNNKSFFRIIVSVAALALVLLGAYIAYDRLSSERVPEGHDATVSVTAPDFTVTDGEGREVSFSELYGRPVVVNFWASWCPPCVDEMKYFQEAYTEYGDRVSFMMVNLLSRGETVDTAKKFIERNMYDFPVYYDTSAEAAEAYQISSIPMTVFVNPEGEIVSGYIGCIKLANIRDGIEKALQ